MDSEIGNGSETGTQVEQEPDRDEVRVRAVPVTSSLYLYKSERRPKRAENFEKIFRPLASGVDVCSNTRTDNGAHRSGLQF